MKSGSELELSVKYPLLFLYLNFNQKCFDFAQNEFSVSVTLFSSECLQTAPFLRMDV